MHRLAHVSATAGYPRGSRIVRRRLDQQVQNDLGRVRDRLPR